MNLLALIILGTAVVHALLGSPWFLPLVMLAAAIDIAAALDL